MKKLNVLPVVLILAVALFGCQNSQAEEKGKVKPGPKRDPRKVIVMGIDDTGSYDLWDRAKNIVSQIILQLQPRDIFYLRRITDESYIDECAIFRLEIPRAKKTGTHNPFDRKAKRMKKAFKLRVQAMKRQAIQRTSTSTHKFCNINW